MPTHRIEIFEGRPPEQKKKRVAESVDIIIITDVKRENWATGGQLWSEPRN